MNSMGLQLFESNLEKKKKKPRDGHSWPTGITLWELKTNLINLYWLSQWESRQYWHLGEICSSDMSSYMPPYHTEQSTNFQTQLVVRLQAKVKEQLKKFCSVKSGQSKI